MDFTIREAEPGEYARLGEITARAYLVDGHLDFGEDDPYLYTLRDVATRAAEAEVLAAVDPDGTVLGGVTVVLAGGPWADIAQDGEAEFRMLAVDRAARGRGVGEALVRACVARAQNTEGCIRLVLSTQASMRQAHRIYERLGFVRTPERDWEPLPELPLLAYVLDLTGAADGGTPGGS
ncbi:GNAT family N-acetyltransferase [Streptomyces sp. NPDC056244]|uniref:GNAT family N-acetyltransferase n=1 Tax=Streptomyces sp. NPDC056244 TaxID=3345762 RepID=UPI0035DB68A0